MSTPSYVGLIHAARSLLLRAMHFCSARFLSKNSPSTSPSSSPPPLRSRTKRFLYLRNQIIFSVHWILDFISFRRVLRCCSLSTASTSRASSTRRPRYSIPSCSRRSAMPKYVFFTHVVEYNSPKFHVFPFLDRARQPLISSSALQSP